MNRREVRLWMKQSEKGVGRSGLPVVSGPERQMAIIRRIGWWLVGVGFLAIVFPATVPAIPVPWLILGIGVMGFGGMGAGVVLTSPKMRTMVFLLGKYIAVGRPGLKLTIPALCTYKRVKVVLRRIVMVPLEEGKLPKYLLHRGHCYARDNVGWFSLREDEEGLQLSQIDTDDIDAWVRDTLNSFAFPYALTLTPNEATAEGRLADNILDRIRDAADFAEEKIFIINAKIDATIYRMEGGPEGKKKRDEDADESNPILQQLREELERLEPLPAFYRERARALDVALQQADKEHGVKLFDRLVLGPLKLSDELEAARERVETARLNAETALYKALQESAGRIAPILDMKEKLQEAGLPEQEALEQALKFELEYTLAEHGGAWALALGRYGGVGSTSGSPMFAMLMALLNEFITKMAGSMDSGKEVAGE